MSIDTKLRFAGNMMPAWMGRQKFTVARGWVILQSRSPVSGESEFLIQYVALALLSVEGHNRNAACSNTPYFSGTLTVLPQRQIGRICLNLVENIYNVSSVEGEIGHGLYEYWQKMWNWVIWGFWFFGGCTDLTGRQNSFLFSYMLNLMLCLTPREFVSPYCLYHFVKVVAMESAHDMRWFLSYKGKWLMIPDYSSR